MEYDGRGPDKGDEVRGVEGDGAAVAEEGIPTKAAGQMRHAPILEAQLQAALVLDKGRSKSLSLNGIVRRIAGMALGHGVRIRVRHIESKRNPTDEGSRRAYFADQKVAQPPRRTLSL